MFECKFILPFPESVTMQERVGVTSDAHNWVEAKLVDQFGGFTAQACRGAWKDGNGHVVRDHGVVYTVAVRKRADADALCAIACDAAELARQKALYFVDQAGPHILNLERHKRLVYDGDAYGGVFKRD